MASVVVVYGTTEGHTRRIAERIAESVARRGHEVELFDSAAIESRLPGWVWDAAVVGASVHQGHHQTSVREFVMNHLGWLERLPCAFFSVSLAAVVKDDLHQNEAQGYVKTFLAETGWHPPLVETFGGALRHARYDYLKTLILRMLARQLGHGLVTSHDVDYTDWEDVDRFALRFSQELGSS